MDTMILVKVKNTALSKFYSGFDKGSVVFHMNDGSNFSYDLFYTGYGLPESFLKFTKIIKLLIQHNFI